MNQQLLLGDNLQLFSQIETNSVDLICSDPPYGYNFMGKDWDIDVPSVTTFHQCLRVLKPGHFGMFFSAPRQDVSSKMITNLKEAGFDISFDSIEWVYASGFPKAQNFAKAIDKRLFTTWFKVQWQYPIYIYLEKEVEYIQGIKQTSKKEWSELQEEELDTLRQEIKQYWHDCKRQWAKIKYNVDMKIRNYIHPNRKGRSYQTDSNIFSGDRANNKVSRPNGFAAMQNTLQEQGAREYKKGICDNLCGLEIDEIVSPLAKQVEGMYSNTLKPARELILIVQKPFSQSTNIDLAMEEQCGGLWLDLCRIPAEYQDALKKNAKGYGGNGGTGVYGWNTGEQSSCKDSTKPPINKKEQLKILKKVMGGRLQSPITFGQVEQTGFKIRNEENNEFDVENIDLRGRFPANLLVSDNILDIGKKTNTAGVKKQVGQNRGGGNHIQQLDFVCDRLVVGGYNDASDFSDKFSLDKWWWAFIDTLPKELQNTFPFLYCPKPSKSEKNQGLSKFIPKKVNDGRTKEIDNAFQRGETERKNIHPTVKSIALMTYLIMLGVGKVKDSVVLDPYMGSGTTLMACEILGMKGIGMELCPEYYDIAEERVNYQTSLMKKHTILTDLVKTQPKEN